MTNPELQGPNQVTRDANDYVTIAVQGEGTRNVSKELLWSGIGEWTVVN
jgi:hypothetical protein